ncbi:MAG TPA: phenylalanine--tRNA ligase subunit beta [Vicinamibacterales bacterium]|nr:phenylalanine--tRNA ligase subunit beta [Vicinamibacterales bacterium]
MKLLVSWLRDFVDVTASPEELGETLSLRGFELASMDRSAIGDRPSAIGHRPSAIGDHRSTIADPRSTIADPRSTIDDRQSPIDDAVLDFEITANRPDALSVIGLAREAATAYSLPMRKTPRKPLPAADPDNVTVTLEAPDLCPRYAAAVAEVTIGPSPAWLATRLQAAGVRPINNVVDVTNYVLLELGQPLHAFDVDKLAGKELRIRRAKKGERIKTLDGTDRALDPEMLVIADSDKAQAIAGVMGGSFSEVSSSTKTIVLESACFTPKSVRLTSKRLGLKTEASARFERGTDISAPVAGLERAVALLEEIGAGRARGGVVDRYPLPTGPRKLLLRQARIQRTLGQVVADTDVHRFLTGLGFEVGPAKAGPDHSARPDDMAWEVTVPTWRVDVLREVDLIEEVGRHYGYDRLPTTFPPLTAPTPPPAAGIERERLVRRILLAAGCSEALTFSFVDAALAAHFADADAIVPIANPLSAQFSVLRPSLLAGLLTALAHNKNRERSDACLFELGATVTRAGESRQVAVAWTGNAGAHWSGGRRPVDFFDLKGLVERIADALQVELAFDTSVVPAYLVRGRAAAIHAGGRPAGCVGMLSPASVASAGIGANENVYVAELDLQALAEMQSSTPLKAKALPRFPSIARDISIVVDDTLPAATVRGTIRSVAPNTLVSVNEFDRYQGKGVPERRVSLSLRLTFRSPERTLTDAEVQKAMDAIIAALIKEHQAVQR